MHGRVRKVSASRAGRLAHIGEGGARARAIRNHPSISRRKWKIGPIANYISAVCRWRDPRTHSLPQYLFQDQQAEILRTPRPCPYSRRLGDLAGILSNRRERDRSTGG